MLGYKEEYAMSDIAVTRSLFESSHFQITPPSTPCNTSNGKHWRRRCKSHQVYTYAGQRADGAIMNRSQVTLGTTTDTDILESRSTTTSTSRLLTTMAIMVTVVEALTISGLFP